MKTISFFYHKVSKTECRKDNSRHILRTLGQTMRKMNEISLFQVFIFFNKKVLTNLNVEQTNECLLNSSM